MKRLQVPIEDRAIRELQVGDPVSLNGIILTGRDAAHKWMIETFIRETREPQGEDLQVYERIKPLLDRGAIYHCGPVVSGLDTGEYRFVAAGPTTSIREEPYQREVMEHFNLKAVIGKGGMGEGTSQACVELPAVYLHAIGGAASLIAGSVREVLEVHKMAFGVPEAMWVIRVENFPAVVTMDAHGESIHAEVQARSKRAVERLMAG
jgi:fumarate hydratase class I